MTTEVVVWGAVSLAVGLIVAVAYLLGRQHERSTKHMMEGIEHRVRIERIKARNAAQPLREVIPAKRFGAPEPVFYRPEDFAQPQRCVNPDCEAPELTPGQAVFGFWGPHAYLHVCLECAHVTPQKEVANG
jgi:hypothetical protein